jgi:hypothetical protein
MDLQEFSGSLEDVLLKRQAPKLQSTLELQRLRLQQESGSTLKDADCGRTQAAGRPWMASVPDLSVGNKGAYACRRRGPACAGISYTRSTRRSTTRRTWTRSASPRRQTWSSCTRRLATSWRCWRCLQAALRRCALCGVSSNKGGANVYSEVCKRKCCVRAAGSAAVQGTQVLMQAQLSARRVGLVPAQPVAQLAGANIYMLSRLCFSVNPFEHCGPHSCPGSQPLLHPFWHSPVLAQLSWQTACLA